jgi:hypothetical protein
MLPRYFGIAYDLHHLCSFQVVYQFAIIRVTYTL